MAFGSGHERGCPTTHESLMTHAFFVERLRQSIGDSALLSRGSSFSTVANHIQQTSIEPKKSYHGGTEEHRDNAMEMKGQGIL